MTLTGSGTGFGVFNKTTFILVASRVFGVPQSNVTVKSVVGASSTVMRRRAADVASIDVLFTIATTSVQAPAVLSLVTNNVASIGPNYSPGATSVYSKPPVISGPGGCRCAFKFSSQW